MTRTHSSRPETRQFDYIVVGVSPASETHDQAEYAIGSARTGMGAVMAAKDLLRRFPTQDTLSIWCPDTEMQVYGHNFDSTDAGDDQLADVCEAISNVQDACTEALTTITSVQAAATYLSSAEKERIAKVLLSTMRKAMGELAATRTAIGPERGEFVDLLMKAEAIAIAETAGVVTP